MAVLHSTNLIFHWKHLKYIRNKTYLKKSYRSGTFLNDVKMQENINHKLLFPPLAV